MKPIVVRWTESRELKFLASVCSTGKYLLQRNNAKQIWESTAYFRLLFDGLAHFDAAMNYRVHLVPEVVHRLGKQMASRLRKEGTPRMRTLAPLFARGDLTPMEYLETMLTLLRHCGTRHADLEHHLKFYPWPERKRAWRTIQGLHYARGFARLACALLVRPGSWVGNLYDLADVDRPSPAATDHLRKQITIKLC